MNNALDTRPIRKPAVAGAFYSSDPEVLRNQIQGFLKKASPKHAAGSTVALIAPHAGYLYSGQTAAYAYKCIQGQSFKRVVVIAPSHHAYFEGVSVFPRGAYQTPLGLVPIDAETAQSLIKNCAIISHVPQAHSREHALEVQLPFLQVVLKSFVLLPVVMGTQDYKTCKTLSSHLLPLVKNDATLIIASSDLSHFHYDDEAKRLDNFVVDCITNFEPEGLSEALADGSCEACGGGPIITAMLLAKLLGAQNTSVLNYTTSGDITGDKSSVVGYVAAAILK